MTPQNWHHEKPGLLSSRRQFWTPALDSPKALLKKKKTTKITGPAWVLSHSLWKGPPKLVKKHPDPEIFILAKVERVPAGH